MGAGEGDGGFCTEQARDAEEMQHVRLRWLLSITDLPVIPILNQRTDIVSGLVLVPALLLGRLGLDFANEMIELRLVRSLLERLRDAADPVLLEENIRL